MGRSRGLWRGGLRQVVIVVVAVLVTVTVAAAAYDLAGARVVAVPALDAHGHRVRTGDLTTHYEQWGTTGPPIVLVHGFLESSTVWSRVGPLLARDGFRAYAVDVRGFGYTQRRGPYTLASDTAQLRAFLGALHLRAPTLVGHSSGAAVVGNLARTDPAAVRRVVFMDGDGTPYGVGPAWVHRLFLDPYATALIRVVTRHPWLVRRIYQGACGPGCPPFDARTWLTPFQVAGAEGALKAILRQQLIGMTYAQERRIRVPAAVLYGAHDPEMSPQSARATAVRLHTGVVHAIPGARHLGMLSSPAAFAAEVARLAGS
ncbi:MAG: alpha/beta fold hydrolase [Nocardioidaceae bacterium]